MSQYRRWRRSSSSAAASYTTSTRARCRPIGGFALATAAASGRSRASASPAATGSTSSSPTSTYKRKEIHVPERTSPGLAAALHARKAPKRKPTEDDRPSPKPFPGRKTKPLPGQLRLEGDLTNRKET